MQNQRIKEEQKDPFLKRILIVDDERDVTLTLKLSLEQKIMLIKDLKYTHIMIQ